MNSASYDDVLRKPEEIFYSTYEPSKEEILEYAVKIGIDPDKETYLVYLARQGLLHPLPENWKPCYSKQIKAYYYYDRATKKSQWEHPIDVLYRAKVTDARKAVSSDHCNLNSHTSLFPSKQTPLFPLPENRAESSARRTQELDASTSFTQKNIPSNEQCRHNQEQGLQLIEAVDMDEIDSNKENDSQEPFPLKPEKRHSSIDAIPQARTNESAILTKSLANSLVSSFHGFAITGLGSQYLKSNQKPGIEDAEQIKKTESEVKGILRDSNLTYVRSKTTLNEESASDEKKSVRFDFDHKTGLKPNEPDYIYGLSNKQVPGYHKGNGNHVESTVEGNESIKKKSGFETFNQSKELQTDEHENGDIEKTILTRTASTDSPNIECKGIISCQYENITKGELHMEDKLCVSSPTIKSDMMDEIEKECQKYDVMLTSEKEHLIEQYKNNVEELKKYHLFELSKLKQHYGEQNLKEIEAYKETLKQDFDHTVKSLTNEHREKMKTLQKNHDEILHDLERDLKLEEELIKKEHTTMLTDMKLKVCHELELEKQRMREMGEDRLYEKIRCEKRLLEDKYKCLKEKYIRLKSDVRISLERRKKRREMQQEPQLYQNIHNNVLLSNSYETDERSISNAVLYPNRKGKSASRLEVAMADMLSSSNVVASSILSSNKKNTASCMKRNNNSNNNNNNNNNNNDNKSNHIRYSNNSINNNYSRTDSFSIEDTSRSERTISKQCLQLRKIFENEPRDDNLKSEYDNDTPNGKKITFTNESVMKGLEISNNLPKRNFSNKTNCNSTSKMNSTQEYSTQKKSCTPLESLRVQFEKLEELEDQIPDNNYDGTYHLRYPFVNKHVENNDSLCHGEECFTDKNVECQRANNDISSELEFFKHRIHLERDSVQRAKESLKMQKDFFLVKKKNMLLKHTIENEQTVDEILKEQQELIEMEISLHRTRTLLSEKL
ncbi:uncharacterized protein MAL13P1.304 isoform X2 [Anopheles darlingi]|uniref:uncharacterized protein MAL13P1.304 isoform X2 n=1 Tax=Anopheles darlingi TaxID=43151 RepID=UPI002100415B|nr:uncharacterized protein MAL13P1.304 isoform X2 [Anopheles darlingi]